jgi:beta-galactosidase
MQVEVYSRLPKVQLFLNDTLVGEQPTTVEQQFKATFTLPYKSGELRAVGVKNNGAMESHVLKTAGKAAKIKLFADRREILPNGQDLSFVSVYITDENGVPQPNADNQLTFTITGPGVIAGVDNANLKDTTSYVSNVRKAWNGRAMVVIKSMKKAGTITLKVSGAGLEAASVGIEAVKK